MLPEFLRRELLLVYWVMEENHECAWVEISRSTCLLKGHLNLLCISNGIRVSWVEVRHSQPMGRPYPR